MNRYLIFYTLLIFVSYLSCTCDDNSVPILPPVFPPCPSPPAILSPSSDNLSIDICYNSDEDTIIIIFTETMDPSSFMNNIEFTKGEGDITMLDHFWTNENKHLNISLGYDDCDQCSGTIKLFSDTLSSDSVLSANGIALDGDGDGCPGGEYVLQVGLTATNIVVMPIPNADPPIELSSNNDSKISFFVKFLLPIDTLTAIPGVSIVLTDFDSGTNIDISLSWTDSTEAEVSTIKFTEELCSDVCFWRLRVTDAILNLGDEIAIDGDENCLPGGNFSTMFRISI